MSEIKDKEDRELSNVRQSMAFMSHQNERKDESSDVGKEKEQKLKFQIDQDIKVLEEADYMDDIIEERQKDIDRIGKIMGDVREITKDFALEVNMQGDKILDVEAKNENTYINTKEANKQLTEASKRSRKNG